MAQQNLALGKTAIQSSISEHWSAGKSPEDDARGANNGITDGTQGFCTEKELSPWWQVDLGSICNLRLIHLYNRKDWAQRLRRFSILASLDENRWIELHRKTDDKIFGHQAPIPYEVQLPAGSVGRFIRLQLHATEYLHFNEFQVFGEEMDLAETANLLAKFEASARAQYEGVRSQDLESLQKNPHEIDTVLNYSQSTFPFPGSELRRTQERRWILDYVPPGGTGAEIGVFRGHFTEVILSKLTPKRLYLVDPWEKLGSFFNWSDSYTNEGRLPTKVAKRDAMLRAAKFPETESIFIEDTFPECRNWISQVLDWIYIDSSHSYEHTLLELAEAAQIVKIGGLILGDDFYPNSNKPHHGVFRAVNEFISNGPYDLIAAGPNAQWCIRRVG